MPAVYAHHRFGRMVYEKLEGELQRIIGNAYELYETGLQGPDIFFFYRYHKNCKTVRYGDYLHWVSARPFFEHGVKAVRHFGRDSREYAYFLGFLCHFILDSECHPYVEEMIGRTGVQHLEIEEEFEKLLLRMDGEDPFAYPVADLIPADMACAEAIAPFYYKGITPEIVLDSLKGMKRIKKMLTAPYPWKQKLLNALFRASGRYAQMKGLMHQPKDNPLCRESNEGLMQRYEKSIELAVRMMESLDKTIRLGTELDARFDRNFE